MPLFRGNSRFESLLLSHHSRYNVTCECNEEDIDDDDDDDGRCGQVSGRGCGARVRMYRRFLCLVRADRLSHEE